MEVSKRLESLVGEGGIKKLVPSSVWEELKVLFSPCCGVGKKTVKIKDTLGNSVSIKSYPVTIDAVSYASQSALEDGLTATYGGGYVVTLMTPRKLLVISNISKKDTDGLPTGVPDFVVKS